MSGSSASAAHRAPVPASGYVALSGGSPAATEKFRRNEIELMSRRLQKTPTALLDDPTYGHGWLPWSERVAMVSEAEKDVIRYATTEDGRDDLHLRRGSTYFPGHCSGGGSLVDLGNKYEGAGVVLPFTREEQKSHAKTVFVGVAYQLTALGKLDTVAETVDIGFEMSMLFKVTDLEDVETLKELVGDEVSFADIKLKNPMPLFNIRSAGEPDAISETIAAVRECVDRPMPLAEHFSEDGELTAFRGVKMGSRAGAGAGDDDGTKNFTKSFYCQTYGKYNAVVNQVMDLETFPFSRMLLRMTFVNTLSTKNYYAVPWNFMLPFYEIVREKPPAGPGQHGEVDRNAFAQRRLGSMDPRLYASSSSNINSPSHASSVASTIAPSTTARGNGSPGSSPATRSIMKNKNTQQLAGLRTSQAVVDAARGQAISPGGATTAASSADNSPYSAQERVVGDNYTPPQPQPPRYRLVEMKYRPSVFKARSRVTESWLCRGHYGEFFPLSWLAAMPSGAKYARFHIVLQMECVPNFYVSNVHVILFLLVCLAFSAFLIPVTEVSDRMQVILTLVLTLAAYKVSLTAWLPSKPYMTSMDLYVLWSFVLTFVQGAAIMGCGLMVNHYGWDLASVTFYEGCFWALVFAGWVFVHLLLSCVAYFGRLSRFLFPSWKSVMAKDDMLHLRERDFVQGANERVFTTKRSDIPTMDAVRQNLLL
eukprot:g5554.t1